jgi:anti-sigma B factor antagonist
MGGLASAATAHGEQRNMNESLLTIQRADTATVARLMKRRISGDELDLAMWNELSALLAAGEKSPIVLDFSQVQYVSSAALGGLMTFAKKCKGAKYELRLAGLCPSIQEVMELMQLDRTLKIHPTVANAIEG